MPVIQPDSFHVWLTWYDLNMLVGCHHVTMDELDEAVALLKRTLADPSLVIQQPPFSPLIVRAGTPVEKLNEAET
jgi:hypothetical protein